MTKAITKAQFAALWLDEYSSPGYCILCGNRGIIDTRDKIYNAAGYECGGVAYCICPNGRAMKIYGGPEMLKTIKESTQI